MRLAAAVALLLAAASAHAKKPKADKPAEKVAVSTAAAGTDLPLFPPTTAPLTLELVARRFKETDQRLTSLKAGFRQFVRLEGSDTVQSVEGEVLFKKPDLLRLTHTVPEPQTVVSDGTWLWVHRKSTNQVIQTKLDAWRKSEPLAQGLLDFGRSADLLERYDAALSTVTAPGADGHRILTLVLTPKASAKKSGETDFTLTLKASTRDFFPGDATLKVGKASIRSIFEGVRLNPELPDATFKFSPPSDADLFKSPESK